MHLISYLLMVDGASLIHPTEVIVQHAVVLGKNA